MTINKTKKVAKYRGSKTHGCGSMKKRRGAGHRGGRGAAGSGKRADVKKPSYYKDTKYFGKYGFTSKSRSNVKPVNLTFLDVNADKFVEQKLITKENDLYSVDLEKLGYNKLLGSGSVKGKFKVTVPHASKKAVEKIQAQGGEVISNTVEQTE